jgi:hypothetical protein
LSEARTTCNWRFTVAGETPNTAGAFSMMIFAK